MTGVRERRDSSELTDDEAKSLLGLSKDTRKMRGHIKQVRSEYNERKAKRLKLHRPSRAKLRKEKPKPRKGAHDYPYAKPIDIPKGGTRDATIIRPPQLTEGKWRKQYRCVFQFENGEKRRWNMANSAYNNLFHKFGENELAWIGKRMRLSVRTWDKDGEIIPYLFAEPIK